MPNPFPKFLGLLALMSVAAACGAAQTLDESPLVKAASGFTAEANSPPTTDAPDNPVDPNFAPLEETPIWSNTPQTGNKGKNTQSARERDWKFFAAIRGRRDDVITYDCGGSVIAPQWVLAAAHCVSDAARTGETWSRPGKGPIEIVLGQKDLAKVTASQVYSAIDVRIAPGFRRAGALASPVNDVALIRLDRDWTGPVVRLSASTASDVDQFFGQAFFAGHGITDSVSPALVTFGSDANKARAGSQTLQAGMIPARSPENCTKDYAIDAFDPKVMLCAGFDGGFVDACQGDSGGPLIARDAQGRVYQIGIVSYGFGCGVERSPGVYARVSAFRAFVEGVVGEGVFVEAKPEFAVTMTRAGLNSLRAEVSDLEPAQPMAFSLSGQRFQTEDPMTLELTAPTSGRLWVFDVDASEKVSLIFPYDKAEIAKSMVTAGERVQLPGNRASTQGYTATTLGDSEVVAFILPPRVALISADMPDLGHTKGTSEQIRIEYPEMIAAEYGVARSVSPAAQGAAVATAKYRVVP